MESKKVVAQLGKAQERIRAAIQEAENLEWHHAEESSFQWQHYLRLVTFEQAITSLLEGWLNAKP